MSFIGNTPAESFTAASKQSFSGDGSTTQFTLTNTGTTNGVAVFVENVRQEPTTAYTVSGTTLTFTAAPVTGTNNIYVVNGGLRSTVGLPAGTSINATTGTFTGNISTEGNVSTEGDVKLTASSGGIYTITGTDTSSNRTLTLPNETGTLVTSSSVANLLEELSFVPQGQTISSTQGNITAENVTAAQVLTDTRTDVTGSSIAYTPPSGTVRVEYNFNFHMARDGDAASLGEFTFLIDGTEVTRKKTAVGANTTYGLDVEVKWVIECAHSSNDTDLGWFTSWTSAKTLKCQGRRLSSAQEVQLHETYYWDGGVGQHLTLPVLTIKAFS